ncbi:hypothetical protein BDQ17DRAFT_1425069 [Cyathus striatus]|nr:hypothetical protein BDQ17DRAFT_1425069 [Cyathus striatus]
MPSGHEILLTELGGPSDGHRKGGIPTPPSAEHYTATSNIHMAETEISKLDEGITCMQKCHDALQKRRDALHQFKMQESSPLAPIRKLPEDVLLRIFTFLCDRIFIPGSENFVLTAIQVSHHWRHVTQSSPILWSEVSVYTDDMVSDKEKKMVGPLLKKCVELSKDVPLNISVESEGIAEILGDGCISKIGENACRWREIKFADGELLKAIDNYIPMNTSFQQLQYLFLGGVTHRFVLRQAPLLTQLIVEDLPDLNYGIIFQTAPLLTHIELSCVINPLRTLTNVHWGKITHFSSGDNNYLPEGFHTLLTSMSNLSSLTISGTIEASQTVTLSLLTELYIGAFTETNVLDYVVTPSLKILRLWRRFDSVSIINFIDRSQCSLEEAGFSYIPIDNRWCVEGLRRVKRFYVDYPESIIDLTRWLTRGTQTTATSLPHLDLLSIQWIRNMEYMISDLICMLKSRLPPVEDENDSESSSQNDLEECYLTVVKLKFKEDLAEDEADDLNDFLESDIVKQYGVDMTIRGSTLEYICTDDLE